MVTTAIGIGTSLLKDKLLKKKGGGGGGRGGGIIPQNIRTGRSSYNAKTGVTELDPSIRAGFDTFQSNIEGLRDPTGAAFDVASGGIRDLQGRSADIRAGLEGNQSAFREAQLNPLRESIARREGSLDRELGRTNVRGSFADQARTSLALESGRALADQEAKIENDRLNKLGDFIGIDADLIKGGLASETGRTQLIQQLESTLGDISSEKFSQELALLKLPASFVEGNIAAEASRANAEGIRTQTAIEGISDIFDDIDTDFFSGGGGDSGFSNVDTTESIFATGR